MPERVDVLVPVHAGTPADHLRTALGSIAAQTCRPDSVTVVIDGPLSPAHEDVLEQARAVIPWLRTVPLPPTGLAGALQTGLASGDSEWVARMDADDIAVPDRLARQLEYAARHGLDVVGSTMLAFDEDPAEPTELIRVPRLHDDIVRQLRVSNPMNHPTVLMRRAAALRAGGYQELRGMEDYDLWARLARDGAMFGNIDEPTVHFRADLAMYRRRRGRAFLCAEVELQRRLRSYGLTRRPVSTLALLARVVFRLAPARLVPTASRLQRRLVIRPRRTP